MKGLFQCPPRAIALGFRINTKRSPCKGKSFINYLIFKAFALTGRLVCVRIYPGCYPGLGASAPSGRVGQNMLKFSYY